ncbi:unnamed protein product [Arctia plantaginis]|uniref:Choline transporter-like protein n=1 Tax=Arctia plantaginis TaxID=874455 RepID=A0A8S1B1R6_ARCPL|nr:unnamed protein product [Arctia plantaginis]CAB3255480.1 unnamed protein product [Arctia plantaginis]
MGKNYGEPVKYDPDFNGPLHNRSCTDVFWLILFIVFLGVWAFVGYYGVHHGNIQKLLAPVDSNGTRCGLDSGFEERKYLVFFDIQECLSPSTPITGCPTPQVCVKECPTATINFKHLTESEFKIYKSSMVCKYDVPMTNMILSDALRYIDERRCAGSVLKSQPALFRCIGDLSSLRCKGDMKTASQDASCLLNPSEARSSLVNKATALDSYIGWFVASCMTFFTSTRDERDTQILSGQIVHDLVESRWFLLGALIVVICICFIYILLLRWVVGPVVWISLVGVLGLLLFCTYLCYKNYVYYRENVTLHQTTNLKGYVQSFLTKSETWMALVVILAIIVVILLLIVIFLRSRINVAVALIREGSKAVTAIKSTVFFPIIPWIIQCFVIGYGALVLMYLLSMGENVFIAVLNNDTNCPFTSDFKDGMSCNPATFQAGVMAAQLLNPEHCRKVVCHFTGLDGPTSVVWLHLANLLGFFWTMFFVGGLSDMMLASTFSTWYWTRRKSDLPFFTLTAGVYRTIRYHPGTVAFGSLIIAIVRVIRVILEYIDQKLKKFDNPFTRCIMCFCKCFCWCLENFLKFISKNAYIMCAVYGYNFCKSAREAFSLLMRNIVRTVVLDKVTDFIFFLSKLLISIGVGVATYYLLESKFLHNITKMQMLHYNYIPATILSIATYLICTIYFKVYEMAVDTLFLCFLEDCERNDGSPEKPYFMSKNLMRILGKKNKKFD